MSNDLLHKWIQPVILSVAAVIISTYIIYIFSTHIEVLKSLHHITNKLESLDKRSSLYESELRDHNQRISKNTAIIDFIKDKK